MGREFHVRFREGLGVKVPRATRLIITGTSEVLLEYGVKPLVEQFLAERGLELSHEKTRVTHSEGGFDFLGQTIRRHRGGKVLLKPSRPSVQTFLTKIQETIDDSGSLTAGEMVRRLNQRIKGWAMYHRLAASSRTFRAVDDRIFWKLRRWCRERHRNKGWEWIRRKYFQRAGDRDWAFTGMIRDREGQPWPIRLMRAAGVRILRWQKIRSAANPYDPSWELYLEERMAWKFGHTLAGQGRIGYLWKGQGGKCPVCRQPLQADEQPWHLHHRVWRCYGGQTAFDNLELLHVNCHRQIARKGY
jgi:RNA-directed DNA polymerase